MTKKLFFLSLAAFLFAAPVQAGIILPNLFATEFCSLREMGASNDEAMRAAVETSMVDGESTTVTIGGTKYDHDVIQAYRAVQSRCPQYLK